MSAESCCGEGASTPIFAAGLALASTEAVAAIDLGQAAPAGDPEAAAKLENRQHCTP